MEEWIRLGLIEYEIAELERKIFDIYNKTSGYIDLTLVYEREDLFEEMAAIRKEFRAKNLYWIPQSHQ